LNDRFATQVDASVEADGRVALPRRAPGSSSGAASKIARRIFFVLSRFAFGAFLLVTSAYCVLMYIPFTYFGFIQHPLLAWLPVFVGFILIFLPAADCGGGHVASGF